MRVKEKIKKKVLCQVRIKIVWHGKCSAALECFALASFVPTEKRKSFGMKILFKII